MMEILSESNQRDIVSSASHELQLQTENHRAALPLLAVSFGCKIYPDGDKWCCLYGDTIQEGVAGFGDNPNAAAYDFESNWFHQKALNKEK